MRLPALPTRSKPRSLRQTSFGGLNLSLSAHNGQLCDMLNLGGDACPLLSVREKRGFIPRPDPATDAPNAAVYFAGATLLAAGDTLYADSEPISGALDPSAEHSFCAIGSYLLLLPEKLVITHTDAWTVEPVEAEYTGTVTLANGSYAGEPAELNTLTAPEPLPFRAGDAVKISGFSDEQNDLTAVIRKMSDDKMSLTFYENTFSSAVTAENITICREAPALEGVCCNENRLWGFAGGTVYASALGDPFNWNVFDGVSTDSYAVATGSGGDFTACCSYKGYPVFFKRDAIYKVYGSVPSKFQLIESCTLGVESGSAKSLAVAGETLFYLSGAGFAAYSGGEPTLINAAFGSCDLRDAAGGSDGVKYYVCCSVDGVCGLYVYDTRTGEWYREDFSDAVCFFRRGGALVMLTREGGLVRVAGDPVEGETAEGDFDWSATFADYTLGDTSRRRVAAVELRVMLGAGASLAASVSCDGGEFMREGGVGEHSADGIYTLRIVPRRTASWRLRLDGHGPAAVHAVTVKYRG